MDFKAHIIALIEEAIPELTDKVQAGAVDERTAAPFAAFSYPEETPVRTKSGIAGYLVTFEVSVYDRKYASMQNLRLRVIAALEGVEVGDKKSTYRSSSTDYYPDYDLHGATMTFRIV